MSAASYPWQLESVQIGAADLGEAQRNYATLLGVEAERQPQGCRFQLPIGAVELVRGEPGVRSITFAGSDAPPATQVNGIAVRFIHPRPADAPPRQSTAVLAIDHVVIHSAAIDRAKAAWGERFGLRLALDKTFEARALRILFFRSGGITLEIAGPRQADAGDVDDQFYGVTYRVGNLAEHRAYLLERGVEVSAIRSGFKPQTSVATVRSATEGVPTLLLEDPSRSAV
jgi:hypothetical protein